MLSPKLGYSSMTVTLMETRYSSSRKLLISLQSGRQYVISRFARYDDDGVHVERIGSKDGSFRIANWTLL